MSEYVLLTDSGCDIKPELLKEWGVSCLQLTFRFDGDEKEYTSEDMDIVTFYNRMREGGVAKTAAINPDTFAKAFEACLKEGKDVLYLGFSSGLSTTYNSARIAAETLRAQYPERKIITVDTLAASAGQGLMVYLTAEKMKSGCTVEEVAAYAEEIRPQLCHWFTVDDLEYLKRGGRVSAAAAFVGGVLGIKPVLHVDDAGKLIPMSKVRGRKVSLTALADKLGQTALDITGGTVFISHGDCMDDVEFLKNTLKEKYGTEVQLVTHVGSIIGAHSGPGTMALFFLGKER